MVDIDTYFNCDIRITVSSNTTSESSSASRDYEVISSFLSDDEAFRDYSFELPAPSLQYPLEVNAICDTVTLASLIIESSQAFELLPDWIQAISNHRYFTTPNGTIDSRIVRLAGDTERMLLLLRSDVTEEEIYNLPDDIIAVKNLNSLADPPDRETLISFKDGWKATSNSTELLTWVKLDHSESHFDMIVISLATILFFRVFNNSKRLQLILSRLTGLLAFAASFWLGIQPGNKCACNGCGCSC